ncbi:MAG: Holliday junction branch migration protein RuvA [Mobiluncus porci]|uniref:Holliday junction branch migration complex subunit RuvA n=1 Tax=Mobiluncus porci TaxID=2652278 RepID=A0A7K0K4Q3_9ACTO|nr:MULTISPECIES: Holliday junction branch migration protein RuvA [Mobiluncus]MCI6584407.1 Holliday junction branch migration protein RuvA [Mobiluncus sp.]MDD7541827.1 Holliday junction branch migration protein RuvA [Mobiluncus porci]MDY5748675.1 Holliday junction branch migration protein RuvA [Mobiluncus porci]MST50424.1 Holliday junction branch migration protein RuvA [Mobiluncus porci]
MIALVQGEVVSKGIDRAVVLAGGIGLEFFAAPATLGSLVVGQTARIHTYLVVREDALTLYGFSQTQERETFATLMGVKGIGPKLGLATLSVLSPAELATAVANRDIVTLQKIPGVGKKSAERMAIEIGDKLGIVPATGATAVKATSGFNAETVVEALTNLGWNQAQATEAVNSIEATDAASALREALKYLGSKK